MSECNVTEIRVVPYSSHAETKQFFASVVFADGSGQVLRLDLERDHAVGAELAGDLVRKDDIVAAVGAGQCFVIL